VQRPWLGEARDDLRALHGLKGLAAICDQVPGFGSSETSDDWLVEQGWVCLALALTSSARCELAGCKTTSLTPNAVLRIQIPEREIYSAVNVPRGIFIKRIFGTDSRNETAFVRC